jgi:predicted MFS family arabinose efflux permease
VQSPRELTAPASSGPAASRTYTWAVWFLFALAYAIVFFQRVSAPVMLDQLRADFGVSSATLGLLPSAYFYGYVVMQLPAGLMIDRWGTRTSLLASLAVSGAGTLIFANAQSVGVAALSRTLVAFGDALVYSSLIKLVVQRFPANRFGFMSALSQVSGFLGGIVASAPLALAISIWGWRGSFERLGAVILGLLVVTALLVRERRVSPEGAAVPGLRSVFAAAARALRERSMVASLVVFSVGYLQFISLTGVWGVALLMTGYGWGRAEASGLMGTTLAGFAVGALTSGYLVDRPSVSIRRSLIAIASLRALCILCLAPAIGSRLSGSALTTLFCAIGLLGGASSSLVTMSIRLALPAALLGTAIGVNAATSNLLAALLQPLLGAILDWRALPGAPAEIGVYNAPGYDIVMLLLAAISLISGTAALQVRERDGVSSWPWARSQRSEA